MNLPQINHKSDVFEDLQLIPEIYRIWEMLDGTLTISFFCKNPKNLEKIINNILTSGATLTDYSESRIHFPERNSEICLWILLFKLATPSNKHLPSAETAVLSGSQSPPVALKQAEMA